MVRRLVEEIRSKKYYVPELDLVMVNEKDEVIGYVMFSRFHLEGKYEDELLMLTPAAVKTELQRQHISKELIEYGFEKAKELEDALKNEQERLMRLRTNIFNIKNGGIPIMNEITIKRIEPIMVVSTRREIGKGAFQEESKMWETVDKFIKANKVQQTIPCMALYHNGTWDWDATKKWDVEVAEPITKKVLPWMETILFKNYGRMQTLISAKYSS